MRISTKRKHKKGIPQILHLRNIIIESKDTQERFKTNSNKQKKSISGPEDKSLEIIESEE